MEKRNEMICEIEGLPLHYHEIGTGIPIMILHGWGANAQVTSRRWEKIVKWPDEARRVYVDLPGHGRTPVSTSVQTADDMLRVIDQFTEEIFSGENYLLLGFSYGGYIARGLVHRSANKIDGVCMLAPLIIADDTKRSLATLEVFEDDPSLSHLIPHDKKDLFDLLAVRNEQILREWIGGTKVWAEAPGDIEFREEMQSELSRYSLSFDVDDLSAPYQRPTLIVTARQDNVLGCEDAWSILGAYPRATFAVLDRTGHLLEDQDDNLAQLIQEWLVRVYKFRQKID